MGFGQDNRDFPTDWLWFNNFVSAQGAGGLLLFSAVSLWRSLREYVRLTVGKPLREAVPVLIPVIGLVISLTVLLLWLRWNNVNVLWAGLFIATLTLITVGIMRIVAEGGLYWVQVHVSFFHIFRTFGLGKIVSPTLLAPLLPIYSVLFLDIKTFMAPSLLNAAKLREDVGGSRLRFHSAIILCLVATVIVALGFTVFLVHMRGAQQMSTWFYSMAPQLTLDKAARAVTSDPQVNTPIASWYGLGAVWVAVSMVVRRSLFWFPHPIGYVMLVNPLITQLWFSFFLGWIAKKVTVKYGGKVTFDKVRLIFIGLIMGELLALFLYPTLSMLTDLRVGYLDLNRYMP
jgi:hypothetical protein